MKGHVSHIYSSDNTEVHLMVGMLNVLGTLQVSWSDPFAHRHTMKWPTSLAGCVTIRAHILMGVYVCVCVKERDRKRERERERQGWMESLTGPPTQPRLMETIITHSHSVCTIRASFSEGGTLSHTHAHANTHTHTDYICAIFFSLPYLFSFLMYKLFLSLCRRG